MVLYKYCFLIKNMNKRKLDKIVKSLLQPKKGILAADESFASIAKRFTKINLESTPENRRKYREMLFTAPKAKKYLSGVILFEETLYQKNNENVLFTDFLKKNKINPGIKVDLGTEFFPDNKVEKYTLGLDDLAERIKKYKETGVVFAKWRAIFNIGKDLPSEECLNRNAFDLAHYAFICQENDIVPIVEPEVLMDGRHDIEACYETTKKVLNKVFLELKKKNVYLPGILLKPNMIISGLENKIDLPADVANKTIACFTESVPAEVKGIVFLSGGQSEDQACANLNAINNKKIFKKLPWRLTYSFGRALQNSALEVWQGKDENFATAQKVFLLSAKKASLASRGKL